MGDLPISAPRHKFCPDIWIAPDPGPDDRRMAMGQTGIAKRTFLDRIRDRILGRSRRPAAPTDRSRDFWEEAAEIDPYDAICDGWSRKKFDTTRESIVFSFEETLNRDMNVLDVACGIGRVGRFLAPLVGKYVGIDFSDNMIRLARSRFKKTPNVEFHVNDGRTLQPLPDDTFHLAFCECAFQHMEKDNTRSYIKEVHRVLRKDGVFLAQIPRFDFYQDVYAFSLAETEGLFAGFSNWVSRPILISGDEVPNANYYIRATK
jgi:SAM-dependent methyltransferase